MLCRAALIRGDTQPFGVFQHLHLEAGPHDVEIRSPGLPPIAFSVNVQPGRTITYRGPFRP